MGVTRDERRAASGAPASVDPAFWRGRRVLLTGHTGFKGAWLALWLQSLGARVTGFSLGVPTEPVAVRARPRGRGHGRASTATCATTSAVAERSPPPAPEVVIHMAAQPLVRRSFAEPRETYATNVMGTVNVLDAVRTHGDGVRVGRQRHLRQVLREPRVGVGLPRGRADGRPRPLLQLQGLRRARHRPPSAARSSPTPTARARLRARRQRDRRRRLGRGPARARHHARRARRRGRCACATPTRSAPGSTCSTRSAATSCSPRRCGSSPEYASGWNFGPADEDARPVGWIVERMSELWPGELRWALDDGPAPARGALPQARLLPRPRPPRLAPAGRARRSARQHRRLVPRALRDGRDMRAVTLGQIEAFQYAAASS